MKIVESSGRLHLYGDDMKAYDQIPAGTYDICFSKMTGFYLVRRPDMAVDEKVYGVAGEKAAKVMSTFKVFTRNLGVILSGDKGIGKSMTAKMIAKAAIDEGYPVILVSEYVPGTASFIESITQEVMILFDEFDKTFRKTDDDTPQDTMLSLFDGTTTGKKLFVVTCNELRSLNDYLVNRPGRFHYHFRFDYPKADEIRTYLQDKLDPKYYGEIESVIQFSSRVALNYDCLRSIAFELNLGTAFKDAILDLNIVNLDDLSYKITAITESGKRGSTTGIYDLFSEGQDYSNYFTPIVGNDSFKIRFNTNDIEFDPKTNRCLIMGENLDVVNPYDKDTEWEKEDYAAFEKETIKCIVFERCSGRSLHYAV